MGFNAYDTDAEEGERKRRFASRANDGLTLSAQEGQIMTNPDDLMQNLLNFPKAPYSCGSAEGWMKKAHDRIEELTEHLKSISAQCDNVIFNCEQRPADNKRHLDSWKSVKEFADDALQPKAGS